MQTLAKLPIMAPKTKRIAGMKRDILEERHLRGGGSGQASARSSAKTIALVGLQGVDAALQSGRRR
jgi:hypothetical protein